jgi:hypothetical protein
VNFHDESVVVAFDVEDDPVVRQAVGAPVLLLDFGKRFP